MPKLYSSNNIIKILLKNWFVFISQKWSHTKYRKKWKINFVVIVPANKKEIPIWTFKSIVRQSSLNEKDFE